MPEGEPTTVVARARQQILASLPEPLRGRQQDGVDAALGELVAELERNHDRQLEALRQQLAQQDFLRRQFEELVDSLMQKPSS